MTNAGGAVLPPVPLVLFAAYVSTYSSHQTCSTPAAYSVVGPDVIACSSVNSLVWLVLKRFIQLVRSIT